MLLLIIFGFVAGAATAVSPCVLPVLPVALSAGMTGGRSRPLGVVLGLALSFTFATVLLVYVISTLGLPEGLSRTLAIVVLLCFGVALFVQPVGDRLEAALGRLVPARFRAFASSQANTDDRSRSGFLSGLVLGGGLGFVYAPCAGPILAAVITVSASQSFSGGRLAVALAYGLGTAVVLYALMLGGRRLTSKLARRSPRFQMAMGAVMVLIAFAMLGKYDIRFENAVASDLPGFLIDPSHSLEESHAASSGLAELRGRKAQKRAGIEEADAGLKLPVIGMAPEFVDTQHWFNTPGDKPLKLSSLRGHVVLVDFWTYSCINCIRTLPYLESWYRKYKHDGFEIVGVHTPEFPFEHSASNVEAAVKEDGIEYPVVQDNDYGTWEAYGNEYWPAEYLIDAHGRIRLVDFGEGNYSAKQRAIRTLLIEAGHHDLSSPSSVKAIAPSVDTTTPESYLGAYRAERFANGTIEEGRHDYGTGPAPPLQDLRFDGTWQVEHQSVTAVSGASVQIHFDARRVYLVLGSPSKPRDVRVLLDGKPIPQALAGTDVHDAEATVHRQRLYRLVNLPRVEQGQLTVELEPGVTGYSFTFG
jgi:cytochrome c biogenesis protein CcdA/thiol-disulfide isomerase/thioredoxin